LAQNLASKIAERRAVTNTSSSSYVAKNNNLQDIATDRDRRDTDEHNHLTSPTRRVVFGEFRRCGDEGRIGGHNVSRAGTTLTAFACPMLQTTKTKKQKKPKRQISARFNIWRSR
jgi:hypothetical protein